MESISQIDVAELKRLLSDNDDIANIEQVAAQLRICSKQNSGEGLNQVADCAQSLVQLLELAMDCQTLELANVICEFTGSNLEVLNEENQSERLRDVTLQAKDRWSEYSSLIESNIGDVEETDHWNDDVVGETELELNHAQEQVALLLSTMNNQSSTKSESNDEPLVAEDEATNSSTILSPQPVASDQQGELQELMSDQDLREAFLDDASRGLDVMEKCSLEFEQNPGDQNAITQFCRELHTLKGASASVGLSNLASDIHEVETALEEKQSNEQTVELMLGVVDKVRNIMRRVKAGDGDNFAAPTKDTSQEVFNPANFNSNSADDSLVRIRASKLDRLMDMLAELVVLRNRRESHISELSEFNDELKRCSNRLSYYAQDQGGSEFPKFRSSQTLSEVSKDISDLSDGIRQMHSPVSKDNLAISHFIRDFRHELMQLRRIPMSGLFHRVQRSARDAAKAEDKLLAFEIVGEDFGLERELQEKLFEPLLHIVRNAVSHGIEKPEERTNLGKNPSGKLSISAQSNSQLVVITVQDDGRGLDYEAIRRRGVEKGLIKANQFLNESELGKLIFHPGFSTRVAASAVSGRGVGMDVVMTTVQQMRGRIEIESTRGEGTSMTIFIPVRSGIEHVMVFRSSGQLFALPMQAVSKVQNKVADANYASIASVLGLTGPVRTHASDVLILRNQGNSSNGRKHGFVIDEILGPEEVVVRKLPPMLQAHPLFSGLTLSGAGETALLLEAERLAQFSQNIHSMPEHVDTSVERSTANILVVDDSISARKLLSKKLFAFGFNVVEAADGVEGLAQIRNSQFDLVFTDLDMPRMGGLELLFDLRQGRHKEQRVVVVSSRSAEEFRPRALELGASAYLSKPVADQELKQLLHELELVE